MNEPDRPESQRARLTKRLILEAFLRLLHQTSFDRITVQAICQEAQINRSTFYRYYDNQFQLLEVIESDLIAEMEAHGDVCYLLQEAGDGQARAKETLVDLFEKIDANIELYSTLVAHVHPNIFEKSEIIRMEDTVRALGESVSPDKARYIAGFIVGGGQKMLMDWISQGPRRPDPTTMAELLIEMIEGPLESARA